MTDDDLLDPSEFSCQWRPGIISEKGEDGLTFAVDTGTLDNGWLRVRDWQNRTYYLPPQQVEYLRRVKTEKVTVTEYEHKQDFKQKRIVNDELREEARRLAQPVEDGVDASREVPADD